MIRFSYSRCRSVTVSHDICGQPDRTETKRSDRIQEIHCAIGCTPCRLLPPLPSCCCSFVFVVVVVDVDPIRLSDKGNVVFQSNIVWSAAIAQRYSLSTLFVFSYVPLLPPCYSFVYCALLISNFFFVFKEETKPRLPPIPFIINQSLITNGY